ncbi:MAG: hypothetical protein ACRDTT_04385 [Pseudonocardiaceae bacterium]
MIADLQARFAEARAAHPAFAGATLAKAGPALDGNYGVNASADPKRIPRPSAAV